MDSSYSIMIRPKTGWIGINFKEVWHYRELLYIFTWRDIKVRYKQTVIGITWAVLQPFFMMVVFSIFFGNFAKIPSNGVPYPIFVFSGLLFWNYFSSSLTSASNSLVDNENMIKKIYFPRLILPLSPTITPMIDFSLSFIILISMMLYFHFTPMLLGFILLPLLIFLSFLSAAGLGFFLSAINVKYRDIRFALPFFIQSLLFVTPVIYPTSLVPERFQWILALNPMTGIIEASRNGIIGQGKVNFGLLGLSALIASGLFIFGLLFFRRNERIFADVA